MCASDSNYTLISNPKRFFDDNGLQIGYVTNQEFFFLEKEVGGRQSQKAVDFHTNQ